MCIGLNLIYLNVFEFELRLCELSFCVSCLCEGSCEILNQNPTWLDFSVCQKLVVHVNEFEPYCI